MASINAQQIKELREKTGAGISDVKKALEESNGDFGKALAIIERKLGSDSVKRAGRDTSAGIVDAYIHSNGRVGAMVELCCETDFVARNSSFRALAHEIAMHVAAMRPIYFSLDSIPQDVWETEKSRFEEEARKLDKPSHILEQVVDGKLNAHFGALSLLSQLFVKEQDKSVEEVINEAIGRFGENIRIGRFIRFEI